MGYAVFKRTGARVETPTLSLTLDGRIGINAAGIRVLREVGVKAVLLLWDQANHRLAIKATHKSDRNAYAVSVAPDNHSGSITAKSFLAHIRWDAPERVNLPATWNESEKMFEVQLPLQYVGKEKSESRKTDIVE